MRSFQYKILNSVLFLNNKLYTFGRKPSLCSFYNLYDETPYMFYECDRVKCLWSDLVQYFQNNYNNGYANNNFIFKNNKCLSNHILLNI